MRRGAVALLDALGFKGIWKLENPWSPDHVLSMLRRAATTARDDQADDESDPRGVASVRLHFLSDTVVAVAEARPGATPSPLTLIEVLCMRLAEFTEGMLIGAPPLAYRGAVAFGDFLIEEPFILGPAVDEAAEAERLAEGAFVWMCPSALKEVRGDFVPCTLEYAVPMKGGQSFRTRVVPPIWAQSPLGLLPLKRLDDAFRMPAAQIGVHVKYQNTFDMIVAANQQLREAERLTEENFRNAAERRSPDNKPERVKS